MKNALFLGLLIVVPILDAHGGHDHVLGTVTAVTETRLDVKTGDGKVMAIRLTGETKYEKDKKPATLKDLKAGLRVVVDADNGKILATLAIGDGCDATAFDADRSLAFASAGDGTITVIKEDGADKFSVAQTVTTQKSARTMTVDEKTHQLFTVAANVGPRPERKMEPDSFVVLVVEAGH